MMTREKPVICFIDDSRFEHDLVMHEIAPHAPEFDFIQTYTFSEVRSALGKKRPALFLLDLWGKDADVAEPHFYTKEELQAEIDGFQSLDRVYDRLEEFDGDVVNEYLKRFFSIVDSWRLLFEKICAAIGQNRKYGLSNLREVRRWYPGVPAVFYTRKSLINDAVALFQAGADALYIKPTGGNDIETRRLTREYAPYLASELGRIIENTERTHS